MAVIKMNFLSQTLGMQANFTVCLPSFSFADMMSGRKEVYVPGMKYQVLWLLHGGSGDDSDYLHFTNITRYADEHKIAVVMPADYNHWYANDPNGGGKFYDYITDELPKVCRALFPFSDKREDNFIGGLSMGMQGASKCAVLRPDLYKAALLMSGGAMSGDAYQDRWDKVHAGQTVGGGGMAIFAAMGTPEQVRNSDDDTYYNARLQAEKGTEMPEFFITVGGDDFARFSAKATHDLFVECGFVSHFEEVPGYNHEWDFWDLSVRKALNEWLPIRHSVIYPDED